MLYMYLYGKVGVKNALILVAAAVLNYPIIFGVAGFVHLFQDMNISTASTLCMWWTVALLILVLSQALELLFDQFRLKSDLLRVFDKKIVRQVLFVPYFTYRVITSPID